MDSVSESGLSVMANLVPTVTTKLRSYPRHRQAGQLQHPNLQQMDVDYRQQQCIQIEILPSVGTPTDQ